MTREQLQALALARARRRRAEAESNPGFLGKVDAAVRGIADGLTLGFSDEISAGLGAATGIGGTFGDYRGNLEAQRARDERDEKTSGNVRLAGQIAGGVALPAGAARNGATLVREGGSLLGRGLAYAGEGAAYGAVAGAGTATEGNRASGALAGATTGAALGVAAPVAVAGISRAAAPVIQSVRNSFGPAESQAANRVISQLRASGMDEAAIQARLAELGPEGALVDVMGARGQALARSASNVSPDARASLEAFSNPRMATQPDRMASALEEAAGLPQGNRLGVEGLKEQAYARVAPEIRAAYDEAKALGYDVPLEDFQEIIGSPMGQRAFREASRSVQNRMAAGNEAAASNLNLLDAMKKRFDATGRKAMLAGDNDTSDQAGGLARALRTQVDEALDGPEYARARALRQEAYRVDDAFDMGAELAGSRVPLDAPARARAMTGADGAMRPEVGQGYAAQLAEAILNRRGTPDALNRLSAPMQREAMQTALGANADRVQRQIANERVFGETHRALTGNSTTARQLAEMGVTAGAGAGLGFLGGLDVQQAGMAGVAAALLRRGGGAAVSRLRAGNEERVAQRIAEALIARGIPATPQGVALAQRDPRRAQAIARVLAGISAAQGGAMAAQ